MEELAKFMSQTELHERDLKRVRGLYPVIFKEVDIDPSEFKPRPGILTTYGKKLLEEGEKYYGKLRIDCYEVTPDFIVDEENNGTSNT